MLRILKVTCTGAVNAKKSSTPLCKISWSPEVSRRGGFVVLTARWLVATWVKLTANATPQQIPSGLHCIGIGSGLARSTAKPVGSVAGSITDEHRYSPCSADLDGGAIAPVDSANTA
ncbi:Uncharacterised protein [Mycolicibacterium fortuitum]|uniref:Uncharacterized protein n=1 Tax=Mycolicibacterium fortuitum TaxID=1766 RepID=A0A378WD22_MYCFO|nr:Uncharacterised protein [Mycolicibacterium fortuitum]